MNPPMVCIQVITLSTWSHQKKVGMNSVDIDGIVYMALNLSIFRENTDSRKRIIVRQPKYYLVLIFKL